MIPFIWLSGKGKTMERVKKIKKISGANAWSGERDEQVELRRLLRQWKHTTLP